MGRRRTIGGLTGVLLVAVAALVVAAGGAARASKVTEVGFASPEKPNDYGWNQQGYIGAKKAAKATGATVIAATGIGYENVEPDLRRMALGKTTLKFGVCWHRTKFTTLREDPIRSEPRYRGDKLTRPFVSAYENWPTHSV